MRIYDFCSVANLNAFYMGGRMRFKPYIVLMILALSPIVSESLDINSFAKTSLINIDDSSIVGQDSAILNANVAKNVWLTYQGDSKHTGIYPISITKEIGGAIITCGIPSDGSLAVTGDFDHDGYLEVAVADSISSIFMCDYRGLEHNISLHDFVYELATTDLDGDGYEELIVGSVDHLFVIIGAEKIIDIDVYGYDGDFLLPMDHDNDGFVELVFENNTHILALNDDLTISIIASGFSTLRYLGAGDLDNDDQEEIIAVTDDSVVALEISGTEIWGVDFSCEVLPVLYDVDNDDRDEVIVGNINEVQIIDDDGKVVLELSLGAKGITIADMNNDGNVELYIKKYSIIYRADINGHYIEFVHWVTSFPIFLKNEDTGYMNAICIINGSLHLVTYNGSIIELFPKRFSTASNYLSASDLDLDGLPEIMAFQSYWGSYRLFIYRLMPKVKVSGIVDSNLKVVDYNVSKYHTYDEIKEIIYDIATSFPERVEVFSIGKSYGLDGNLTYDIIAVKITNGINNNKPAILVIGAHHARELITAEAALYLIVNLAEQYSHDSSITTLLDNFDVYIVPVLNVGGHDYALYFEWLRKNLRPVDEDLDGKIDEDPPEDLNNDGYIYKIWRYTNYWTTYGHEGDDDDGDGRPSEDPPGGVDLNRNYNYSWSNSGAYGDPSSEIYSGPYPLSEPETKALDSFMREIRPIFAMSLHSGEETIFYPWGTGHRIPFEYNLLTWTTYIAQLASGFGAMQSCSIYEAAGVWDDHAYGFYGIISFTPEIFTNERWPRSEVYSENGAVYYRAWGVKWHFNPFPEAIEDTCIKVLNMFLAVAHWFINVTNDNSYPVILDYDYQLIENNVVKFTIRAYDNESGIHLVKLVSYDDNQVIEKDLVLNQTLDAWVGSIKALKYVNITVVNRAGLKITKTLALSVIVREPMRGSWLNTRKVTISWDYTNASIIDHLELYLNDTLINSSIPTTVTRYTITVPSDGYYIVKILIIYVNGENSTVSVEFYVDTTPPIVEFISPQNNTSLCKSFVNLNWSASDNLGLSKYELYKNNILFRVLGPEIKSFIISKLEEGTYLIKLVAYDKAGNYASSTLIITIDLTPPSIIEVTYSPEQPREGENVAIKANISDNLSGIWKVLLYYKVNEENWVVLNMSKINSLWVAIIPGQGKSVSVEFYIEAYDVAGNIARSDTYSYTVMPIQQPWGITMEMLIILVIVTIIVIMVVITIYYRKQHK